MSEKYDIVYLNLDDEMFDEMVSKVIELQKSRIFTSLWDQYGEELKDEVVTIKIIFNQVWSRICEELKLICQQFYDGEMKLQKIDEYLDMFEMEYDAVVEEFMLLFGYFNGPSQLEQIKKKVVDLMKKVKSYKKLFNAQQAAEAFLRLQKVMSLEGDFSQVENIQKVWP